MVVNGHSLQPYTCLIVCATLTRMKYLNILHIQMLYNVHCYQDIWKNLMHMVSSKQTTFLERLSIYHVHRFAILQAALKSHENYDP